MVSVQATVKITVCTKMANANVSVNSLVIDVKTQRNSLKSIHARLLNAHAIVPIKVYAWKVCACAIKVSMEQIVRNK